jgi:hypothetical protein
MTQDEFEKAKEDASTQGIDLTQIALIYTENAANAASSFGHFTHAGQVIDCDGKPLPLESILEFQYETPKDTGSKPDEPTQP